MSRDTRTIAGELLLATSLAEMTTARVHALAEAYLRLVAVLDHVRLADRQRAEMDADRERRG